MCEPVYEDDAKLSRFGEGLCGYVHGVGTWSGVKSVVSRETLF